MADDRGAPDDGGKPLPSDAAAVLAGWVTAGFGDRVVAHPRTRAHLSGERRQAQADSGTAQPGAVGE
jgi:hypothetical protein